MTNSPDALPGDTGIDLSDVPELDEAWFRAAALRQPHDLPKTPMRIDADDHDAITAVLRSFVRRAKERAGS